MNIEVLEQKWKKEIHDALPEVDFSRISFAQGGNGSPDGIYIFADKVGYHFLTVEKGMVREHIQYQTEEEIFGEILETLLFDEALNYAVKHRQEYQDFRRVLFAREIELHSKFGEKWAMRKQDKINKILQDYPYQDKTGAKS